MATVIIAVNQTGSAIMLDQITVEIPAGSGSTVTLTDYRPVYEIQADDQLKSLISAGDVILNDGTVDLDQAESLQYLEPVASIADLQQPATDSTDGYMSAGDKGKLDGIAVGATNTPLTDTNPVNVRVGTPASGSAVEAARQDHQHSVATAAPTDVGISNSEGSSPELARASHVHRLPFSTVASVLGTEAGANAGWVFKADGAGSGSMQNSVEDIPNRLVVGTSGDVQYTSIKTAVDYATSQGASDTNPWLIRVYPGNYTEAPMTVGAGIAVIAVDATDRTNTVLVTASNAAEDLFTMTGGSYLGGFELEGVTDASKALVRCATASSLTILHGIAFRKCSTGLVIENGASVIMTNPSINVDGAGISVDVGIQVTGTGSYLGCSGGFFSAPSAVLPAYPGANPIQQCFKIQDSARATINGATFSCAYNVADADVIFMDGGSETHILSCEIRDSCWGSHIGSSGTGTVCIVQGGMWDNNVLNGYGESVTAVWLVLAASDVFGLSALPGTAFSGIIQKKDDKRTALAGDVDYVFAETFKSMDLREYIHAQQSTGYSHGGEVTAATGLNVDVAEGVGFISRHGSDEDAFDVSWDTTDDVSLTASSTNYVVYDSVTEAVLAQTSAPSNLQILLATVVTDGSGIRFLHQTRNVVHDAQMLLHDYLLLTRKIAWISGLAVSEGTTARKFDVTDGSWYRALDLISITGDTDVTFSYFYGTDGATEVASQTELSITQYDNAGTLTSMTAGYFRADTVIVTSDGRISVIYGTEEFDDVDNAKLPENKAAIPTFMADTGCYAALIVIEQGVGIDTIVDIRPDPNAATSGGGGGSGNHSALTNLDKPADHPWAFLVSGARAMSGDLDVGGNAITNVGNVDGVDVSGHASRHNPGGGDALATGTPSAVQAGVSPAAGSAASYARSDHQHGTATPATPQSVGTSASAGSGTGFARDNHVHEGLPRTANDFTNFTQKASPINDDRVLVEDSADSYNKKWAAVGDLPGGGGDTLAAVQARRTTTLTMPTSWTDLSFDTTDVETDDGVIEHDDSNRDRIQIKEAGLYLIDYHIAASATAEQTMDGRVRINDTTVVPGSEDPSYIYTGERNPALKMPIVNLAAGDYLTVQVEAGGSGVTVQADSTFSVIRLEGLQGPPGSGTTLTIREGGTNVTGTPHSALNFDSGDFSIANDGGGQATVSLSGSVGTDVQKFNVDQTTGGQTLTDLGVVMEFDATETVNTDSSTFSWDGSDELTILRAGTLTLHVGCTFQQTSGNGRTLSELGIQHQPSGGSYSTLTSRSAYTRNDSNGYLQVAQLTTAVTVGVNDKIRCFVRRVDGGGTMVVRGEEANLTVEWCPAT